jgi:hypothetical protein
MNNNKGRYIIKAFLQRYEGYYYPSNWFCNPIEIEKKKNVICDCS